tara:strand:+ start:563 stop:772 length:210 start_codon:yes stop_codon:yes gene_type:complete
MLEEFMSLPLKKTIHISFDKKVAQLWESFALGAIERYMQSKAGFEKTVSHELLSEILGTSRALLTTLIV